MDLLKTGLSKKSLVYSSFNTYIFHHNQSSHPMPHGNEIYCSYKIIQLDTEYRKFLFLFMREKIQRYFFQLRKNQSGISWE